MRILVDGDACPNKDEIRDIAIAHDLEMIVFVDYAHMLEDDYYKVVHCEIGQDSVDMSIINTVQKDDLVITQDYGLASLALGKKAIILHPSGMVIDASNIDALLMRRYFGARQRRSRVRVKGPSKRTQEDEAHFLDELHHIINTKRKISLLKE